MLFLILLVVRSPLKWRQYLFSHFTVAHFVFLKQERVIVLMIVVVVWLVLDPSVGHKRNFVRILLMVLWDRDRRIG